MRLIYKLALIALILVFPFSQIDKSSLAQTIYVYVNHCREGEEPQDGSPARPYATLSRAVAAAPPGSTLLIQAGNYPEDGALPLSLPHLVVKANSHNPPGRFHEKQKNPSRLVLSVSESASFNEGGGNCTGFAFDKLKWRK